MKKNILVFIGTILILFVIICECNLISGTLGTGGDITYVGEYTIHTFKSNGTFIVTSGGNVEVLVVAGGGSGGGSTAGGGGAGGLIYNSSYSINEGSINVTVGSGGAQAASQSAGNSGANSSFGTLIAIGGGGGGFTSAASGGVGKNGGSGGGGATYGGRSFLNGTGTPGQGNDGGRYGTDTFPGGGGGGAGSVGSVPTGSKSGNGGIGLNYSINGSNVYYAGGGGGGSQTSGGDGGLGGGGNGTSNGNAGVAGTNNTGGGGGGGWFYASGIGGAGGSGIVIIKYLTDIISPNITLNAPETGLNTSSQNISFNFTATDETSSTLSCSIYLDGVLNQSNSSVLNNTLTNFNISGMSSGLHTWKINCSDAASNSDISETRNFYIDLTAPTTPNITYSPNATDDVDPLTTITINATILDNRVSVSTVILQYYNGTTWANKTMTNTSLTNYNATFTTVSSEQNYTFNIWANDTFGNSGISSNTTFNSTWDCSWSVSPSGLEETVGFYEDREIGNITIINTGDINYTNNNCSVSFTLGYTGLSQNYALLTLDSSNWATTNKYFQYSSPVTVNATDSTNVSINFSFPSTSSPFTETPTITLTASINNSVTRNKTASVSSTLITSPPNPLLFQEITDYPTTYVYLTPGTFNLSGYVRNLGGDNSEGNTAYNITSNWTLPSSLSSRISQGSEIADYTTLTNNSRQYNNLTITFTSTNILSMGKGTLNLTLYSYGYDNKSELIINSGNKTILNNTVSIQFLCYDVKDTYCVADCGVGIDPDCSAPSTESATSSAGGGGGGGQGKTESASSKSDYQLLRGKQNEVKIPLKNSDINNSLKDITIKVSGKIAKYISINPETIDELKPNQEINIILTITSPTYIELGKQEITITITGKRGSASYLETKKITLEIHELTQQEATDLLLQSQQLLDKLEQANFSYDYLNQLLNESQQAMLEFGFEKIKDNHEIIRLNVDDALNTKKIIEELTSLLKTTTEKGIETPDTSRLLKLAELSLDRREFEQAYKRAKDAQLSYALETKGELGKVSYYLKEYPAQISLSALAILLISFGTYKISRLQIINSRIKKAKEEEKILTELMKVVQTQTFIKNEMSMDEYQTAMEHYQKRLSNVIEELIDLENQKVHALRFTSKSKQMNLERQRVIDLIKQLQEDYLNKGNVETQTYELRLESYNRRITEIDEKLAVLEAKRAMKIKKPLLFRK